MTASTEERLYATLRRMTLRTLDTNDTIAAAFRLHTIGIETHANGVLGFTVELKAPDITAWMHMPDIHKREMSIIYDDLRNIPPDAPPPIIKRRYTPSRRTGGIVRYFPTIKPGETMVGVAWRLFKDNINQWLIEHDQRYATNAQYGDDDGKDDDA